MGLSDEYNFEELRNDAERLVIDELEQQLLNAPASVCRTEECILDMAAFALNMVRPMYRVTLLGRLYAANVEEGYAEEIRRAVQKAIQKVNSNPS